MDFRMGTKSDEFREEVRAFLDEHLTDDGVLEAHETVVGIGRTFVLS